LIAANTGYTALLYSVVPTEQDDSTTVASFYLSTFDNHGTQIDIMEVAGSHEIRSPFKVFSMQPSLQFTVQEFAAKADSTTQTAQTRQETADSARITPREPLPLEAFQIAANGKFEKIEKLALR